MERLKFIPLFAALMVSSCRERAEQFGEDCSIKSGEIRFTKSLNNAARNTTIENMKISIRSDAKKDYFNEPNGTLSISTAPVLLSKVDNAKPFTLTAKITPSFDATYDAGALYIFSTDQLWQ